MDKKTILPPQLTAKDIEEKIKKNFGMTEFAEYCCCEESDIEKHLSTVTSNKRAIKYWMNRMKQNQKRNDKHRKNAVIKSHNDQLFIKEGEIMSNSNEAAKETSERSEKSVEDEVLELKCKEQDLTEQILTLEAERKRLNQQNLELKKRRLKGKQELEELQSKLKNVLEECERDYNEYQRICSNREKVNSEISSKLDERERVRTEISEKEVINVFVYDSGEIEVNEVPYVVEKWQESFHKIIDRTELEPLSLGQVKILSKALTLRQSSEKAQKLQFVFESESVDEVFKKLCSI